MFDVVLCICGVLAALLVVGVACLLLWGARWGSTETEREQTMPGDGFLAGGPSARVCMTRAVSIRAQPDLVWPWLAQLGRGAGWYSIDWLDNGRRSSARHILSWVPEPQLGDASPIGYLGHIEPRRALTWWVKGVQFCGAEARLVTDIRLTPERDGSRLVIRMSADAAGGTAGMALFVFRVIDSIMACSQLRGIRRRVECFGVRENDPGCAESGAPDQYQCYEVIYASGQRAGVPGREQAARWRQTAIEDGILDGASPPVRT